MICARGAWQVGFWSAGRAPERGDLVGCATLGAAYGGRWVEPGEAGALLWGEPLRGLRAAGTCREVLNALDGYAGGAKLALAFFSNGAVAEAFLDSARRLLPGVAFAGGASADGGADMPGEVSLLLVEDGAFDVLCYNALDPIRKIPFKPDGSRVLAELDGRGAREALSAWKRERGVSEDDFESLTVSDEAGRNLHLRVEDGRVLSGANLPAHGMLTLRHTPREAAAREMADFCAHTGALTIGCAGLKKLLSAPFSVPEGALTVFLYGEVVYGAFGNLMLARVTRR